MMKWLLALMVVMTALPASATPITKVVSPGGIEAWLVEDHSNPVIDLEVTFAGGLAQEPANKSGLVSLLTGTLDEGAGSYPSEEFHGKLEDLAIQLSFSTGMDGVRGHLKTITDNADVAFDLFTLALTQPRFDAKPLERVKGQILAEIAEARSSPGAIAARSWYQSQWPGHPYARDELGDPASVKALTSADLKGWKNDHMTRDGLIVGVSGDIAPDRLGQVLDQMFGRLPAHAKATPIAEARLTKPGLLTVIDRAIPQSVAIFGAAGFKREDPDWYAALVMNYILGGGGFSSWLTDEVRERRGLAYSVSTALTPLEHGALIIGRVATRNEKMAESIEVIRAQWDRMRTEGPSAAELEDAKTFLIGSFPLQFTSTTQVAGLMVAMQRDHLGIDYLDKRDQLIAAVGIEDVKRVAGRLAPASGLSFTVVGRPQGLAAH